MNAVLFAAEGGRKGVGSRIDGGGGFCYDHRMPRRIRASAGGMVYHVLNRGVGRMRLFRKAADFAAMENVLEDALKRTPVRLLAYCILSNHWHMLLWPRADGELSEFMRWLTLTHTQRWHANRHTSGTGPIYQGRFKSFPVQSDEHLLTVARYIERNPLRAGIVQNVQQWQWSSLWRRCQTDGALREILSDWPVEAPRNWTRWVQQPQTEAELEVIRRSVLRGRPFGEDNWARSIAKQFGLESTFRSPGRQSKAAQS